MPTPIRIKRRLSPGAAGAPSSLYNAELAFNENDKTLYYGYGIGVGTTVATSVISIAGEGAFVTLSTGQTISGTKTFISPILISPNIYDTNNSSGLPNQVLLKYGSGISWGPIELTATINQLTFGNYISGTPFNYFNGVNSVTFGVAATSVNTANQVVARDASGNFSAGIITANSNVYSTVFDVTQATLITTATTQVTLSSISSSTYSSAEYMITAIQGANYNTTKLLLVHDGTDAYLTEYGSINVGNSVATFDADINTGNIRLLVTPASASSTKFQVAITAIRV